MVQTSETSTSSESYSSSSSFDRDTYWIEWFCSQKSGHFYVEVDEEYIQDDFNLTGLRKYFEYYDEALNVILACAEDDEYPEIVGYEATQLYGLIHARFLLTTRGQTLFKDKVTSGTYGTCPNHFCDLRKQPLLPWGEDLPKKSHTFVLCPSCNELYRSKFPRLTAIDGAHFGSSAAVALASMAFPELSGSGPVLYDGKLFGFRTHVGLEERALVKEALTKGSCVVSALVPTEGDGKVDSESD